MFLNHIISWGMVAMLTSLTMTTGSVDRNSTSSQNNNPASVEEATEGCATHFGKRTDNMFKYVGLDYTKDEVENLENWVYTTLAHNCGAILDERACAIFVSDDMVIFDFNNEPIGLDPDFELDVNSIIPNVYYVTGGNSLFFDQYNEINL